MIRRIEPLVLVKDAQQAVLQCIFDNDESLARATADLYAIDYEQVREDFSEEIVFAILKQRC